MGQDKFTKLFKYVEKRFDVLDKTLKKAATKDELNQLTNAVDAYAKSVEDAV